ncbi:MAG TPA: FliM/FliN family flagellar motor switch protein [Myxococcaceae bacterium]|nr:FliM/FliN family flagellar motor switch protein [Myxococcaceae bacterium]
MPAPLNPDEVQALMSAIQQGQVAAEAAAPKGPVTRWDLANQDRIIRGQMPTLDAINDQVASRLGVGWSGRTRLEVRAATAPASLLKFADASALLAPPAVLCLMTLGPSHGSGLLVIEAGLAEALLVAALGDRKIRPIQPSDGLRELTAVEQNVLRRLLNVLTAALAEAWEPVVPFKPEVLRFEPDPRLASIIGPTEVTIVSAFELSGAMSGRLQLLIPFTAVEPAKARLSAPPRLRPGGDERFSRTLAKELEQVSVEIRGVLGRATLTLSRLLALDVGEVVLLGSDEASELPIQVQRVDKLTGQPCISGGSHALVVSHPLA